MWVFLCEHFLTTQFLDILGSFFVFTLYFVKIHQKFIQKHILGSSKCSFLLRNFKNWRKVAFQWYFEFVLNPMFSNIINCKGLRYSKCYLIYMNMTLSLDAKWKKLIYGSACSTADHVGIRYTTISYTLIYIFRNLKTRSN